MKAGTMTRSEPLGKSLFIRGLRCPKSRCRHKRHPERRDAVSEEKQALFDERDPARRQA
jgi:hypothetical protein